MEKTPAALPTINVRLLDVQHGDLIENLRRLEAMMDSGSGRKEVPKILRNLAHLANFHFPTEEQLMLVYEYPMRALHAQEHQSALRQLRKLNQQYRQGDVTIALQLLESMKAWILNHVETWDMRLGEYLNSKGVF
jgi:hemerythrin-like metal-binding protein